MTKVLASRRKRAMRQASRRKLHALIISHVPDVSYLSGFEGDSSWLVLADKKAWLLTDGRFGEQAKRECPGVEVVVRKGESHSEAAAKVLKGCGVRRLGYQANRITVAQQEQMAKDLGERRLRGGSGLVADLRAVKDEHELKIIRKAISIAQEAYRQLLSGGAKGLIGRTEQDIAAELEYLMRKGGADGPSFETIVAAGPNGSNCHYRPDSRRVKTGEALLIDWGARVSGYCSDLTRTAFLGTIPPEMKQVYEVVRRGQAAGIAALRPGVACKTADAAARESITEAGYGEQFVHSLGHGVGREVHEAPGLGAKSTFRLRRGMVVTVEPGVYFPGRGGVRIEDDVLITSDGARRLSTLPRGLKQAVVT